MCMQPMNVGVKDIGQSWVSSSHSRPCFLRPSLSGNLELNNWLDWLTRSPQNVPIPASQHWHAATASFLMEVLESKLKLLYLGTKHSTHWAISPFLYPLNHLSISRCLLKYFKADLPHDPASCTTPVYLPKGHQVSQKIPAHQCSLLHYPQQLSL